MVNLDSELVMTDSPHRLACVGVEQTGYARPVEVLDRGGGVSLQVRYSARAAVLVDLGVADAATGAERCHSS
jgi:hypothetical protein